MSVKKKRVLFISPGPVPLAQTSDSNPYHYLARYLSGDVVSTIWSPTQTHAAKAKEAAEAVMGDIRYHPFRSYSVPKWARSVATFAYFIKKARELLRLTGGYDAVITYGALTTGVAGLLVSRAAGVPLIVDLPGHPFRGLALQGGTLGRAKAVAARWIVPQVLKRAQGIKLLYPAQLADLRLSPKPCVAVFHDFAAVSALYPQRKDDKYILLLGHPWYLKGVDVLIKAFNRITSRHPGHRLLVVGHCPDPSPFEMLAAGNPQIELRKAVFAAEARELIASCSVLVVASRTEAMGRVILEAFAAEKPVIASRVDGIPFIVKDESSGLLFESENDVQLAECIDRILSTPELAARLAAGGAEAVREKYTAEAFATHYNGFIDTVVQNSRT